MYEILEKTNTYEFLVVYETTDLETGIDFLNVFRKKYPERKFKLIKVIK